MEPVRDAPWAEYEKVYLLAEILKASPIPSHVLFGIIRDSQIQPRWNDIALPHGRSLRSCQMAFNDMAATYSAPDYRQRAPQLPVPIVYPGPDITKKRPHQPEISTPIGRLLQPRPPHSYPTDFINTPTYPLTSVGEPANKKKRGRPTKAEAQARAAARGEVYPPPRKSRASVTAADVPPGEALPPAEAPPPPGATPPGPGPVAATASMTPQPPQTEGGSESTSSKKKRSKPTPLELEKSQREPSETESPSAFGSATGGASRSQAYSSFTPISAPLPSATESRDRDVRMEGVEESLPRTTTPHSFKDTVGI
ncbi:hypothetical protein K469DRAFT_218901 [Zopfia rhizophila CBS 207.26]|uniref:Myb-like domain-containing protein n=1 Tax=Zopfia rhizophila CBS 207.26 TaxID=1314779 RepID=A0A6A6DWI3_9PEZI|nr:hypothetical protein K469DRAFT_218901 [Zopfia rhizophila CBS 207.26]